MELRSSGETLFAVVENVGQPPQVELQALVLVTKLGGQPGLSLLLVCLCLLAFGGCAVEVRPALGLPADVSLDIAVLALPLLFQLLALTAQHAFEE
jgi:hypothetical protein